jgi:beta-lactamase regulating signal transducer with metallopeptidase domain
MSGPTILTPSPWVEAIGWMLLHSLWQGTGVAMVLLGVLYLLRRGPSQVRHLAACAAMVLVVALPISTHHRSDASPRATPARHDADRAPAIRGRITPIVPGSVAISPSASSRLAERLESMLPVVVALWMAGVGVFSLRLWGGWVQARRWVRQQSHPLADPWPERVKRLRERLGVRRVAVLLESARVEVPMVVGWLRPAILVPVAALAGLSAAELEAILAHELAHIRRHDYVVNMIQCVVEVLMFYHPAAWWISRVIRREREECCDDLAVATCRDRLTYARALAAMEGLRAPAFSPSPAASGGILLARVRRILEPQEESMNPVRILAGLAVVLAAAPLWLARAGGERPVPEVTIEAPTPPSLEGSFPDLPSIVDRVEGAPTERTDPFPNRSFADLVTSVEEAPTGRFITGIPARPTGGARAWDAPGIHGELAAWFGLGSTIGVVEEATSRSNEQARPTTQPLPQAAAGPEKPIAAVPATSHDPDERPSGEEVWERIPRPHAGELRFYKTRRDKIRVVIDKIADRVDPVKVYPNIGPCQLVHKHYKCTVYYDEICWSDDLVPFNHLDHKVAVIYIDKDHLRPAPMPAPEPGRLPAGRRLALANAEIGAKRRARQAGYGEPEWFFDHRAFEEMLDPSRMPPGVN